LNGLIGFDGAGVPISSCYDDGFKIFWHIALATTILSPTLNGIIGFDGTGVEVSSRDSYGFKIFWYITLVIIITSPTLSGIIGFDGTGLPKSSRDSDGFKIFSPRKRPKRTKGYTRDYSQWLNLGLAACKPTRGI
jgi:hypothetical protein